MSDTPVCRTSKELRDAALYCPLCFSDLTEVLDEEEGGTRLLCPGCNSSSTEAQLRELTGAPGRSSP